MADKNKEMLLGFTISNAIKTHYIKGLQIPLNPKSNFRTEITKIVTRKRKSYQTSVFCSIFGCNN